MKSQLDIRTSWNNIQRLVESFKQKVVKFKQEQKKIIEALYKHNDEQKINEIRKKLL